MEEGDAHRGLVPRGGRVTRTPRRRQRGKSAAEAAFRSVGCATLGGTPAASIQSRTAGDEETRTRHPRGGAEAEGTDGQAAGWFPGFRPMDAPPSPRAVRRL